jgi:hypothetical protein
MLSWQRYEREKARKHNGRRVGGPGNEDYSRGKTKGEVKHRQTPVTRPEAIKIRRKGVTEIDSLGGFTEPAKKYAESRGIKLFQRGRRIV